VFTRQPQTPNPKPQTPNPKPQTPNPKPQTPNPKPQTVLVGFRSAYVFDVSQTEGAELPEFRRVNGDVGENRDRLLSFLERQGIELVVTENIAPHWA
jgi:hypothetical protein